MVSSTDIRRYFGIWDVFELQKHTPVVCGDVLDVLAFLRLQITLSSHAKNCAGILQSRERLHQLRYSFVPLDRTKKAHYLCRLSNAQPQPRLFAQNLNSPPRICVSNVAVRNDKSAFRAERRMPLTGLFKTGVRQADERIHKCSKYSPEISFYDRLFLLVTLQIVDCPDDSTAANANPANCSK